MGFLRLLLAALVVLSHTRVLINGYNPGVVAVVIFFILSGYVMTILIERHYSSLDRIVDFYRDRAARLYPQFMFYALATLFLLTYSGAPWVFTMGCDPTKRVLNLLMLPLGFYQFIGLDYCLLVPQAWSLGLEATFYIAVPILVIKPESVNWAAPISLAVFVLAYFGIIDTDAYGYRLLPGTLFIFLVGFAFARGADWRRYPWFTWFFAAVLYGYAHFNQRLFELQYSKEVLFGLLVGIPTLALIRLLRFSRVDELLGNLSYGVFLNHVLCILAIQTLMGRQIDRISDWCLLFAVSAPLSLLTFYAIERPVLRWRRNLRYRSEASAGEHLSVPQI